MIKESFPDKVFLILNKLFIWLIMFVILYPLIYVVSASISDPQYVDSGKMWLYPMGITFEGFQRVFQNADIWTGYRNTLFYTTAGTFINLTVTLPCAYALSRPDVAGRKLVMAMLVFTMFFSGGLIPTYLLVKSLGILDTVWALLIPGAATTWNIIISRTFFQSNIPRELVEAAEMDGCTAFRLLVRIVLPLSAPIITVMGLFYAVGHWNSYFDALIYLRNRNIFPLQLFLREILVQQQMNAAMMMNGDDLAAMAEQARIAEIIKYAIMIVSALPLLVVYPFVQKYFVRGILVGSLKG